MSELLSVDIQGKSFIVDGAPLQVLQDIKFQIQPGQFVTLLGPSGCGKTTLLRMVLGLDIDYEGNIAFNGERVMGPHLDRGAVFQEPRLLPWMRVEANIAFAIADRSGTPRARDHVRELVSLLGLSGFERAWPSQLSGGMAQRAAIARALVNVPKLLVMDEPLGALDSYTRVQLQKELTRIHQREAITTLMVTHDVDEAVFMSDSIMVLTPRPARVRRVFCLDLAAPRDRNSQEFVDLRSQVLRAVYE